MGEIDLANMARGLGDKEILHDSCVTAGLE